jgi:predicted  nucleic acid-binding Zn-ribbon protein
MAKYRARERNEHLQKLKLTLSICSNNKDEAFVKLRRIQEKFEKAKSDYEETSKTLEKAEEQLRDFYGSLEGNVKKL